MSREIMWQICHEKKSSNRELKKVIVNMLQERGVNIKQAASDLDISVHRAHNWYYKNTGMTALDLLRIVEKYMTQRLKRVCTMLQFPK